MVVQIAKFDATLGLLALEREAKPVRPPKGFGGRAAHVAQLVEHVLGKDEVTGSIPVMGSRELATGVKVI
jgi:hypothetical protein